MIPSCSCQSVYAQNVVELKNETIDFNKDLAFVQKTILEDHPGIWNHMDPRFTESMQENARIAEQKLFASSGDQQKIEVLQAFGRSFCDAHFWIRYESDTETVVRPMEEASIGIQQLNEHIHWVKIPTFCVSNDQVKNMESVIASLLKLREQNIVVDLRGNGGGNSVWGEELLKSLFGEEFVNQKLEELRRRIYVEWRVSQGNLDHLKGLIPNLKEQFGQNHPAVQEFNNIYEGIQQAFLRGEHYYVELPNLEQELPLSNAENDFKGSLIAIIDRHCGSACLDFIDLLKAMKSNVVLIGEPTGADSVYMELREVRLPSGKGTLGFPIKVYRNRSRGHNEPHQPDITYPGDLMDTTALQRFLLKQL